MFIKPRSNILTSPSNFSRDTFKLWLHRGRARPNLCKGALDLNFFKTESKSFIFCFCFSSVFEINLGYSGIIQVNDCQCYRWEGGTNIPE